MRPTLLAASGALLCGCGAIPQPPTAMQEWEAKHPVGRYAVAGKIEYSNGVAILMLDTRTGQACKAVFLKDLAKPDFVDCTPAPHEMGFGEPKPL